MKKDNNSKEYISSFFKNVSGLFQKNLFLRSIKKALYYVDAILLLFIKKPKYENSKKKKVLLIYNLAFGDGVIFRCALIHIRKIYPKNKYDITLICQNGINKLYEYDELFDEIIPINFNKSTVSLKERFRNFKIIRRKYYDIVIDPVGTNEWLTNIFYTRASVSKEKIGYHDNTIDSYCSLKKLNKIYTKILYLDTPSLSLIEYYGEFFNMLSNKKINIEVGFEKIITMPNNFRLPEKYYIIFPSASMQLKRYSVDSYAFLAEKIYNKTKMKLVIVGTNTDKDAVEKLKEKLNVPYIDLFGKTSLNDYIDIIKKSSLVVTNDTSAYHIAVIEEVPCAIITGGYTYYRYVEYKFKRCNEYRKPCIIIHKMPCFDCGNRCKLLKKDSKNWPCLEKITKDYAWKKIEKLLDEK